VSCSTRLSMPYFSVAQCAELRTRRSSRMARLYSIRRSPQRVAGRPDPHTKGDMTNKSATKHATPKPAKSPRPASRLTMEQRMREISRVLEGKEFADDKELNTFLASLVGPGLEKALHQARPLSATEEAQELAYAAMEAQTEAQARRLAKRALAKDPDCIDALGVLTGIEANSPKQVIEGLQKAVAAGERSLGSRFFKENKGAFWGLSETRPYMRARQQLAEMFEATGLNQDAISQYEAMLELNPNDNQGVREPLLGLYLRTGDSDAARKLLKRYKRDASAVFAWGRVLERILADDLDGAAASLQTARKENPFMELYMTAQRPLPEEMPHSYAMGSAEEALVSLDSLAAAWTAHPAAMFWLLDQILGGQPKKNQAPRSSRRTKDLIQ
jgi:tetratricopeptide (TPR) repeat protein